MRKTTKSPGEKIVKDTKRATRTHYSSEDKIRIVLDGLRGEDSIAELCRREGISSKMLSHLVRILDLKSRLAQGLILSCLFKFQTGYYRYFGGH